MWQPIKASKMGKNLIKNQYRKVAHVSIENILKNRSRRWLQGICDGVEKDKC